jgi:hypothetical protein
MVGVIVPRTSIGGCLLAVALFAAIATTTAATTAAAQTLADPYPHPTTSRPTSGKSAAAKPMKSCPEFGAGFYRVEGSNTCVKVGGFVEGTVTSSHH